MSLAIIIGGLITVALVIFLIFRKPPAVDKSIATYKGPIAEYRGGKKLVVAFTVSFSRTWRVTESELRKLDKQKFDLAIVDACFERATVQQFDVKFLPTVGLIENGTMTKSIQNLTSIEQIKDW